MEVKILNVAKEVFEIESKEIANLSNLLTADFEKAINSIYFSKGKCIVSGMGKSGIIGKKIAATLASTGTSSFFLHPGEAYHGDLGMIEKNDIVVLISNSGETEEVLKLIPFLKNQGNIIISMSSNPSSTLSINSTFHLNVSVEKEACPLQLAPTSSTTATLVMGDAMAVCLMKLRNFKNENFAQFHPGGILGRKLLTKVKDVMSFSDLPIVNIDSDFIEVIDVMTSGKLGVCIVYDDTEVVGVITDGDLRRALRNSDKLRVDLVAQEIMTKNPKYILEDKMLMEAEEYLLKHRINVLIVKDESDKVVGVFQMYDLNKLK